MRLAKALMASLLILVYVFHATPAQAAVTCGPLNPSESRTAVSGDMTLTATADWKNCSGPERGEMDDPRAASLAYVWNGNPNCDSFFGGFIRLDYTFTFRDDAGTVYSTGGIVDCQSDGIHFADIPVIGPMLIESENSRWSVKVTARYNNAPDHSVTMYGDF